MLSHSQYSFLAEILLRPQVTVYAATDIVKFAYYGFSRKAKHPFWSLSRKEQMMPLPSVRTLRRRIEHFRVDLGSFLI